MSLTKTQKVLLLVGIGLVVCGALIMHWGNNPLGSKLLKISLFFFIAFILDWVKQKGKKVYFITVISSLIIIAALIFLMK